jgi:alkanesulfonate monooxygenase SsuD/methylene tetrahydromethanopterin reductase-like flavin-dependent oxidoreductase (luciferase family)
MRPLDVGIQLPEVEYEVPFRELIRMARTAEAVGFDSIWLGDHLLYDTPAGPRGPWEVWTSLAALAACTERIRLGPLVASTSFHAPAMLAKLAATVDEISNGRLILGLGAGWNRREYDAYGFPYDHRVSRFEESFTIIRRLLHDGEADVHGRYVSADRCVLHPRPAQPIPLMVGSVAPRMLSITLPHVVAWNMWWSQYGNTPRGFASVKARVDELIVANGRASSDVKATCCVYVQLAGGDGRPTTEAPPTEPLRGSTEQLAEQLRAFADAGAQQVHLVVDPITNDSIEYLAEVLAILDQ